MRIVAISNQKGGVGKTTTTVTLGHGLALEGAQVLIIDLDAQGSAGHALGLGGAFERTTYDLLIERRPARECTVQARDNLWLLPSDTSMVEAKDRIIAETAISTVVSMNRGRRSQAQDPATTLARAMEGTNGFDYVLLDCAPGVDIMSANALMYASEVIMPISVDFLATVGAGQHVQSIVEAQAQGSSVFVSVVLPTFYEARTRKAQTVLQQLRDHFGNVVADPIPKAVGVAEAPSYGKTLWEYDPSGKAAAAYRSLVGRIANG